MSSVPDLLEVHLASLGLSPGATLRDVKSTHRTLIKVWHPDRFVNDPSLYKLAEDKLKQINCSYLWLVEHAYLFPRTLSDVPLTQDSPPSPQPESTNSSPAARSEAVTPSSQAPGSLKRTRLGWVLRSLLIPFAVKVGGLLLFIGFSGFGVNSPTIASVIDLGSWVLAIYVAIRYAYLYVRNKGRHWVWALLSVFGPFGWIFLLFLPEPAAVFGSDES